MVLFEKKHAWEKSGAESAFSIRHEDGNLVVSEVFTHHCGCCGDTREIEIPVTKEELVAILQKLQ